MGNNTGWVCPKCGKVHAPWVPSCDCKTTIEINTLGTTNKPNFVTNTTLGENENNQNIQMICD